MCIYYKAPESLLHCFHMLRRWRSAATGRSTWMDTPAGCESSWCPAVRQSLLSRWCKGRLSRATPRHPASRSVPGGSEGRGCCSPPCWLSRRAAGRRSCRRSRRASAQSSRPDASMSSPQLPRCCRRSSACDWSSPGSQREALWGSGLERDKRVRSDLLQTSATRYRMSISLKIPGVHTTMTAAAKIDTRQGVTMKGHD